MQEVSYRHGEFKDVCLVRAESIGARKAAWPANGFAFAAKKSIICEIKLYDHGVLDGNDILFLCAIYGEFEIAMERLKHNRHAASTLSPVGAACS